MKLIKGPLKLCAVYCIFVILMLTLNYLASNAKAQFLYSSLAWFPAGIAFGFLDLFPVMYAHPWMNTPVFLFSLSFFILYLVGFAFSVIKLVFSTIARQLS
jgi:hypothetical protein